MAQFLDIGSGCIAYDRRWHGPVLVFSHASLVDRRVWRAQLDALAEDHDVIAYDRLGQGDSSEAPAQVRHGVDLVHLVDALDVERAALVGSSMGRILARGRPAA